MHHLLKLVWVQASANGGGWLWKRVSKRYANPKLVLNVEKVLRTYAASDPVNYPSSYDTPVYAYSIRVSGYTDHLAYRLQVASCYAHVYTTHLDYFNPAPAHGSVSFTLEILDTNVEFWDGGGDLLITGREAKYVSRESKVPPIIELRLDHTS